MNLHNGYLFILFDIPSINKKDKRIYNKMLKLLKSKGFIMAVESSYYKYYDNINNSIFDIKEIREVLNNIGKVYALKYTVNDFNKIILLAGESLLKLDNNIIMY